jgi:hypothetical protein
MADSDGIADGEADEPGDADGGGVGGSYVQAGPFPWAQAPRTRAMATVVTICNVRIREAREPIVHILAVRPHFWPQVAEIGVQLALQNGILHATPRYGSSPPQQDKASQYRPSG